MTRRDGAILFVGAALAVGIVPGSGRAAATVPTDIQQPGTQPGEVANLETPDKCDNCHQDASKGVTLADEWRGSMMAHAGRDPIFWATLAIAEQDFDGAGDLCIRCHSTAGWLAGRSTPTDGSGLQSGDADGVECSFCHQLTNPDDSEHLGEQFAPFLANDGGSPATGYYGSGMASVYDGSEKLGPYANAVPPHPFLASLFHRSVDFCGTCHDVSNPAVGDLAHNQGAQPTADPVVASGTLGGPVTGKAAFNNFPYRYGVVERTYSEYKSGQLVQTRVSDYATLPAELQAGAIAEARANALLAGNGGDYADGAPRTFSCQTCHMRPRQGLGCNKNGVPQRSDLPTHDLTGGNYWMPQAIAYLNGVGKLRLGGGMSASRIAAMNAGAARARHQLEIAAALSLDPETFRLRVTNLTGHKLITGYPEGRRMWLRIRWHDDQDQLLREDGGYGPLTDGGSPVTVVNPADGQPVQVDSILDLEDPHTVIYEAHYGLTREWAAQLVGLGHPTSLPVSFDRLTGAVEATLGDVAAQAPGTDHESFHFALNNTIVKDNRIPTWGMRYDEARARNALPVPASQYGNPGPGGVYEHWDEVALDPPAGTFSAEIELLYQPTSWEYVQFLQLANDGGNPFLATEGDHVLEAWLETGMAAPHTMASLQYVPEPGRLALLLPGLALLLALGRGRVRA